MIKVSIRYFVLQKGGLDLDPLIDDCNFFSGVKTYKFYSPSFLHEITK